MKSHFPLLLHSPDPCEPLEERAALARSQNLISMILFRSALVSQTSLHSNTPGLHNKIHPLPYTI